MTSDSKDIVLQAFTQLVTTGVISDAMKQGIEDRVAESLDIDTEKIQREIDKEAAKKIAVAKKAGIAVDQYGNPLPTRQTVEVPPDGSVPSGGDKPAVDPAAKPVNQSDQVAGADPKELTDNEISRQRRSELTSRALRKDLIG